MNRFEYPVGVNGYATVRGARHVRVYRTRTTENKGVWRTFDVVKGYTVHPDTEVSDIVLNYTIPEHLAEEFLRQFPHGNELNLKQLLVGQYEAVLAVRDQLYDQKPPMKELGTFGVVRGEINSSGRIQWIKHPDGFWRAANNEYEGYYLWGQIKSPEWVRDGIGD